MTKFRVSVASMPERSYIRMVLTRAALFVVALVIACVK